MKLNELNEVKKEIGDTRSRIDELRKSIKGMESTFIQVAKDLPIQWFDKSFSGKIQPANRLSLIKYWCE
jgi:archaellum component FlaC